MERERAFTPKVEEEPEDSSLEAKEEVESRERLGELADDEKKVASYNFFLNRITSGSIGSEEELKARFGGRFKAIPTGGTRFLRNEKDEVIRGANDSPVVERQQEKDFKIEDE